jgi:hypothetical protein
MPHEVLYNKSYGFFQLSEEVERILSLLDLDPYTIPRHDPRLIDIVKEIGIENAGAPGTSLEMTTIDSDQYIITEYDGSETVCEPQDLCWIDATVY